MSTHVPESVYVARLTDLPLGEWVGLAKDKGDRPPEGEEPYDDPMGDWHGRNE